MYDGVRFTKAARVVTCLINYRLGAFGFMCTGASSSMPPNLGLHDQVCALRWIKQYCGFFGGDTDNITVFGESAGGMSVSNLMVSPLRSCGVKVDGTPNYLFHKVIAQSGATHHALSPATAQLVAADMARRAGIEPDALTPTNPALLSMKAGALYDLQMKVSVPSAGMAFSPVAGCSNDIILPIQPLDALASGIARDVVLMTGMTTEESKLFLALGMMAAAKQAGGAGSAGRATPDLAKRAIDTASALCADPRWAGAASQANATETATNMWHVYQREVEGPDMQKMAIFGTDVMFGLPLVRQAEVQSRFNDVFVYRFAWKTPVAGGMLGACHALELPFIFGSLTKAGLDKFSGHTEKPGEAERLSKILMQSWAAFAHTGKPGTAATGPWGAYTAGSRTAMLFGEGNTAQVAAQSYPPPAILAAWEGVGTLKNEWVPSRL
jgi:para-nitrobenzyl esterase